MQEPIRVLFVCLGNICRSPLAEGAFRALVHSNHLDDFFEIDSAGTGGWHAGEPPDPRSIRTAQGHSIDIGMQRSRVLVPNDLVRFDYIFAMDLSNRENILKRHHDDFSHKVHMFLSLTENQHAEVPDPYYDRIDGFEHVWALVSKASNAWLEHICKQHNIQIAEN